MPKSRPKPRPRSKGFAVAAMVALLGALAAAPGGAASAQAAPAQAAPAQASPGPAAPAHAAPSRGTQTTAAPQCVALPFGFQDLPGRARSAHLHGERSAPSRSAATTGSLHLLVILAAFSDVPPQISPTRFQDHLFGSTGATLSNYYTEASQGLLDVSGTVTPWVTLPETEFYYSQGAGGVSAYPNNGQRMTEDAVTLAVAAGVDLGDYDADGDGVVDALLIIHSGQGFEWASVSAATPQVNMNAINSHKWGVTQTNFGSGARVTEYFTGPELQIVHPSAYPGWSDTIATIGVFCHELGHILGLPDYYDTLTGDNRVGAWDVMDVGNWLSDTDVDSLSAPGALPTLFSAWSRMFLEWVTPLTLTAGEESGDSVTELIALSSSSTGGRPLQLLANPGGVDWTGTSAGAGEYFLAEVRTSTGFDAALPSEGLIVCHVDESRPNNRESEAPFAGGGLLVQLPQDNNMALNSTGGDPWPGAQSTFDETSAPSSDLHNGLASGVSLADIGAVVGGTVTFTATAPVVVTLVSLPAVPYAQPHPWHPGQQSQVELVLNASAAGGPSAVHVYDARGRRVRTLTAITPGSPHPTARWDGRSDGGLRVPSGMYFFRASGSVAGAGKVLLIR